LGFGFTDGAIGQTQGAGRQYGVPQVVPAVDGAASLRNLAAACQ
jgi:hypothetical protein